MSVFNRKPSAKAVQTALERPEAQTPKPIDTERTDDLRALPKPRRPMRFIIRRWK